MQKKQLFNLEATTVTALLQLEAAALADTAPVQALASPGAAASEPDTADLEDSY